MAPFLGALAIIVIVVIAIWLFKCSAATGLCEDQRVGRAAVGQNDALQRQNFADFRAYTCATQQGPRPMCLPANVIRWPNAAPGSSTTSPT